MATPLSLVGMQTLFPTIMELTKAGADEEFARWARDPQNASALMAWYAQQGGVIAGDNLLVTVPDVSAAELIEQVRVALGITDIDGPLREWDIMRGEGGKTFEVSLMRAKDGPAYIRSPEFPDGYVGSVAAYLAWIAKTKAIHVRLSQQPYRGLVMSGGVFYPFVRKSRGGTKLVLRQSFDLVCNELYVAFKPQ